jgi:hypothetical protein
MKRSRLATYAMGIAVAAALTGCGGDDDGGGGDSSGFADESAETIIKAASEDMAALKSVHLTADLTSEGNDISLDLSLDTDANCEGTVGIGGGSAEILGVGDQAWFKADDTFWQEQAGDSADQIIGLVGDKWVVDNQGQFTSFCDLDGLLSDMGDPESLEGAKKDGTEDVDGTDTVKITGDDGGSTTTAFISADDPHHILKLEVTGDDEGEASFSAFDEELEVEAPAEAETTTLQ